MTTKETVMNHLKKNNSYFKWSATRIAEKFNCSVKTVDAAINELTKVKSTYLRRLNG